MDHEEYVAARLGRLREAAADLGVPPERVDEVVDRVLERSRGVVRRREDPHPEVLAALEREVRGHHGGAGGARVPWPAVAALVGLASLVGAAGVAGGSRAEPVLLPSLFARDTASATTLLDELGLPSRTEPVSTCEPAGLVVGAVPPPGSLLSPGSEVVLRTAAPYGTGCEAQYADRADAWAFVAWAAGHGPAPRFADRVGVVVDRSEPAYLTEGRAADLDAWGGSLEPLAAAAASRDLPTLEVVRDVPPAEVCGVPRPVAGGEREALTLRVVTEVDRLAREADVDGCPVSVDLYREDGVIDAVVVHTPRG